MTPVREVEPAERPYGSPFVLGAVFARPSGDQLHPATDCELCAYLRKQLIGDPAFRAEFTEGKEYQERWLRMYQHRRAYRRRHHGMRRFR